MELEKIEPLFRDADGRLYQQIKHSDAIANPNTIRQILPAADQSTKATVRWFLPVGTVSGSKAAKAEMEESVKGTAADPAADKTPGAPLVDPNKPKS